MIVKATNSQMLGAAEHGIEFSMAGHGCYYIYPSTSLQQLAEAGLSLK